MVPGRYPAGGSILPYDMVVAFTLEPVNKSDLRARVDFVQVAGSILKDGTVESRELDERFWFDYDGPTRLAVNDSTDLAEFFGGKPSTVDEDPWDQPNRDLRHFHMMFLDCLVVDVVARKCFVRTFDYAGDKPGLMSAALELGPPEADDEWTGRD